ncbi:MAG: prefoldin subunit alpha [Candidatus Methanomethylicaceae archaeon]
MSRPAPPAPLSAPSARESMDPLLAEFNNLKGYSDALRQQIEFTASVIAELSMSKGSLEEIKAREGKGETLVHIGAGNYIRVQLDGVSTVVMGIGAGVSVEKTIADALTEVESRLKMAQQNSTSLQQQYYQVSAKMDQLQGQIEELYQQLEPGQA